MTLPSNIEIVEVRSFAGVVADEIVATVSEVLEEKDFCSIALSGGGTPSNTYRALTRPPRVNQIDWKKVKLFWGDERWVDSSDNSSNYKMVNETLINSISIPSENIFPVPTTLSSPEEGASAYQKTLIKELSTDNKGTPIFDLLLLGVGEDGHIASLFPGQEISLNSKQSVSVGRNTNSDLERVTLTAFKYFS